MSGDLVNTRREGDISHRKGRAFWRQGESVAGSALLGVTSALRLSLILVSHSLETSEVSPRISHCCNSEVGMAPSGISGLLARVQKSFFGW